MWFEVSTIDKAETIREIDQNNKVQEAVTAPFKQKYQTKSY